MKITCALRDFNFSNIESDLNVFLYSKSDDPNIGSIGAAIQNEILKRKVVPSKRAWDIVSIALAVIAADTAGHRKKSPDGWTRVFDITISVIEPDFWEQQKERMQKLLAFLTTDCWTLRFVPGGNFPFAPLDAKYPNEDSVVLLSGGLDSYIGLIDLVSQGKKPLAVSQIVRGDRKKQINFASTINEGRFHFSVNHNVKVPKGETPASQRSRSIIFLAYGILMATTLDNYHKGDTITLYVCENGFIALNPPLTGSRIGSLSTRTTHPVVLSLMQQILTASELNVRIENPYQFMTKGEMLINCLNQNLLLPQVYETTSCGRFKQHGYKHCGRCVPCLVRRAAFNHWIDEDITHYVYNDLSINDEQRSGFDDVRSMLMAIETHQQDGTEKWIGSTLSSNLITDKEELIDIIRRGLFEIDDFMKKYGVK